MKHLFSPIGVAAFALATALLSTGCALTKETTTIQTPAVYNISKDASGALQTNLTSAASVTTSVKKERLYLPEGYALLIEDDMLGTKIEMTSASSTLPNIIFGQHHGSMRWVPTSTNQLYAAAMSANGSIDNKAVPFWISSKGTFTAGSMRVMQVTDTNGTSSATAAIVPGTAADQTK